MGLGFRSDLVNSALQYYMNSDYLSLLHSCFRVINLSENGLLFKFGEK